MTTRPKGKKFRIRRGYGQHANAVDTHVSPVAGAADEVAPPANAAQSAAPAPARAEDAPAAQGQAAPGQPPAEGAGPGPQAAARADAEPGSGRAPGAASTTAAAAAPPSTPDAPLSDAARASLSETGDAAAPRPRPSLDGPNAEAAAAIAAIKAEGLTGRQLRMARRTAMKHGISSTSDYDAIRQLRARGIDPFAKSNMLELIVSDEAAAQAERAEAQAQNAQRAPSGAGAGAAAGAAGASQTLPAKAGRAKVPAAAPNTLPAGPIDEATRATEIMRVQRDIARRRQRRLALLFVRLAFFVFLPTALVGYYFFIVATPLYATHTEFKIDKAEGGGAAGGLGGLFGGTGLATATDSITVQSFLESREAMLRLDEDLDFRGHFSDPGIDPLIRLAPDASNEAMYDTYRRNLDIGYDPTEGIIRLEMRAADPTVSQQFSEALIRYAEERVDQMSQRVREDQMAGASDSFQQAEERMLQAQQRVIELQEQRGVLSTEAEVSTVFQQISTFELQLQEERLRLSEMMAVSRPNETRVEVAEQNIARLEQIIEDLRGSLTDAEGDEVSLARVQSELIVAEADLETRQMLLAQALQQMETARIEANRQSLYLSIGVYPVVPDDPAYPKAMENTLLAFLVFSGIYLMISMTAAILREQVSA